MDPAERNYDTGNQETLVIVRALTEWRPELEGLQRMERFIIHSDHGPLQAFMTTKKLNGRQSHWQEFLSRFYFVIHHKPGKSKIIADILCQKEATPPHVKQRALLKPEMLGPSPFSVAIEAIMTPVAPLTIAPISGDPPAPGATVNPADHIIERILLANWTHPSLNEYYDQAADKDEV
jgi:hypothetical protein